MAKPLMIQEKDDQKIEELKEKLGAKTKIEVVRNALDLLAHQTARDERIARWKQIAQRVSKSSAEVLKEFQPYSRLKRGT
ncbi:MAG: hypothetical protein A3F16_03170 [Deltaproteobacteria bacterium RIFCSPHIGHO2_12_FULL_43_9]|nr:MAG: hypothetical protein A3F16_03170 [Deltaproteobacteria bacterium RIFCSPHIGHO2_12_FULL_43_9]